MCIFQIKQQCFIEETLHILGKVLYVLRTMKEESMPPVFKKFLVRERYNTHWELKVKRE